MHDKIPLLAGQATPFELFGTYGNLAGRDATIARVMAGSEIVTGCCLQRCRDRGWRGIDGTAMACLFPSVQDACSGHVDRSVEA